MSPVKLLILASLLWRSGCARHDVAVKAPPPKANVDNTSKAAIRKAVPVGTPVDEAKRTMKHIGFKCHVYTSKGQERLSGRVYVSTGFLVGQQRTVTFRVKDGRVAGMTFTEVGARAFEPPRSR